MSVQSHYTIINKCIHKHIHMGCVWCHTIQFHVCSDDENWKCLKSIWFSFFHPAKAKKYISQPTLTKCDTLQIAWDFVVFGPNHWPYDSRQQHNGMEEQCVFGWMMSKTTKISQNKLKNGFKVCSVAMFCFLSETMQYFKRMVSSKCSVRVLSSTAMQDSLISEQNVLFD